MAENETFYNVPDTQRLYITKGRTTKLYITLFNEDLTRLDLTSAVVHFKIKKRITDTDARAIISKVSPASALIADAQMSLIKITLTSADTSVFPDWYYNYIFDLSIVDGIGDVLMNCGGTVGVYPSVVKDIP